MFIDLIEAVAACLDRESSRRIARLDLPELVARHAPKATSDRTASPNRDAIMGQMIDHCAIEFFSLLQRKARAVLRQPAASDRFKD